MKKEAVSVMVPKEAALTASVLFNAPKEQLKLHLWQFFSK